MSSSINNISTGRSYTFIDLSEDRHNGKNLQNSKKKKQIVSLREGKYYCTYIVNEKGQKILLNRIPIAQVEEQKSQEKPTESSKKKPFDSNLLKSAHTAFECKQQINIDVAHKKNMQEIMGILKEYAGIPHNSGKTYGY